MRLLKIVLLIIKWVVIGIAAFFFSIFMNYHLISWYSSGKISRDPGDLPGQTSLLVLGAGHIKPDQWINYTLLNRLDATRTLYESGKVQQIIVSGSYTSPEFNEAGDMRNALITFGIPENKIISDTLGNRTLSSVMNLDKRFGVKKVVIVSQRRQLERAIFLSSCMGIEATGMQANPPPYAHKLWTIREYLSRVKATCDCISLVTGIKDN